MSTWEGQVISRSDIAAILQQWYAGKLTAEEVHEWAERLFLAVDYDDREGEDEESVANEVLGQLDMLDMNLMLADDIPIYLDFLNTPHGHFKEGYHKFNAALSHIDIPTRRKMLKDVALYAPYCR